MEAEQTKAILSPFRLSYKCKSCGPASLCRGDAPATGQRCTGPIGAPRNPTPAPSLPCPQPPQGPVAFSRSREREETLTRVSMCRQQTGKSLQPRHQQVFRKKVKYFLQGLVGLQGVLQVALLHHRQVFVL